MVTSALGSGNRRFGAKVPVVGPTSFCAVLGAWLMQSSSLAEKPSSNKLGQPYRECLKEHLGKPPHSEEHGRKIATARGRDWWKAFKNKVSGHKN
jgi:hypothetical protein